jgi:hypothetical protein
MNTNLSTMKPLGAEPPVTLFLKPSFGITVQSSGLAVSVSARPEGTRPPSQPSARG